MARSVAITIQVADLNDAGRWLLDVIRQQRPRLAAALQPQDGLIVVEIGDEDAEDQLSVRLESLLPYDERVRRYGIRDLPRRRAVWSGELSPQGWPIPTEGYVRNLQALLGEEVQFSTWLVPKPLVQHARVAPDQGAEIINLAGEELRAWLEEGQFRIWRDPDWISLPEATQLVNASLAMLRNAVRAGRLRSWDDPDEPDPQRRTQVRESQVRRRWPARRAQERG